MNLKGEDAARAAALASTIACRLGTLSTDELRVVDMLTSRMLMGRATYGPLSIAMEKRDWKAEATFEANDMLFYLLTAFVAQQDARLERLQCEMHDELSEKIAKDESLHGFLGVDGALRELRDSAPIAKPIIEFDMSDLEDA